jgi:hypothetical protein
MIRIPLTQGQHALVDDCDAYLFNYKWHAWWSPLTRSFYAVRMMAMPNGNPIKVYMHRQILGLRRGDKRQADHKNHDTLDNTRKNLRIVTHQENHFNLKNTKGYSWNKQYNKYQARIKANGKHIHLGMYNTKKEARKAYLEAKAEYHHKRRLINILG